MEHEDHVRFLQDVVKPSKDALWADVGCGEGAFTLALADCLYGHGTIHALDQSIDALETLWDAMQAQFPNILLKAHEADFNRPLPFPRELQGLVIANALHFVPYERQIFVLINLIRHVRVGGAVILVEYNSAWGNKAVPYPISMARWATLAAQIFASEPTTLWQYNSRFMGEIYSSVIYREL
ncbi:MAG: class I SAM-dependent methyltransferase [Anaerolineales bacterium]